MPLKIKSFYEKSVTFLFSTPYILISILEISAHIQFFCVSISSFFLKDEKNENLDFWDLETVFSTHLLYSTSSLLSKNIKMSQ